MLLPFLLMLLAQIDIPIVNIFYEVAISKGMPISVLVAYRFIFATNSLAPLVIWGPLYQNLYLESLRFTSATFTTVIVNLTPVVTFILAIKFGFETLELRTLAGKLKIIWIILSPVGVALLTFCHLMEINIGSVKFNLLSHIIHETEENHNLVLGLGLAVMATLSNAVSLILQKKIEDDRESIIEDDRESILLIPSLINVMGAIQATIYALCVEKDWAQWKLGWDIKLWAALFVGVIGSGLNTTIITFCVSKMGPVFVSACSPMGLIVMVVFGSSLLNEKLYLTREMPVNANANVDGIELREMPVNANADADADTDADADADAKC
ncbi:WAT1-related protein At1g25270-like [Cornus florida]|uniref:WAT1-related protein At1g25270-like n=1 Tax=Cornus florida TaxID=4283 RepID=UPI002899C0C0|nr:WAT1-related protein At1g25270-like [Cornus florida]